MKPFRNCCLAILAGALWSASGASSAEPNTARPAEKDRPRHEGFLNDIRNMQGTINLVFVGDSITDGWRWGGLPVWRKFFAVHKALNLGISADRTEHVLWRLKNGELDGYEARLFVIMIGTNNGDSARDVATGIKAILSEIEMKQPQASILLLAIFPRGESANDRARAKNSNVNKLIATYADGMSIHYLDIGDGFLRADGSMNMDVMPDALHPNLRGYEIWADAINGKVKELLSSSTNAALAGPGPYRKLASLAARIRAGVGFGQILRKLASKKDSRDPEVAAEAKMMLDALRGGGQKNLDVALSYRASAPLVALSRLTRLAAQFAGDEIGTKAKTAAREMRKDPQVAKEIAADLAFRRIRAFENMFRPAAGGRNPRSPEFRKRNAQGIVTLIRGCQQLIRRYPGTAAAHKAEALMRDYRE